VLAEQPNRIAIICWRSPAFRSADVLRDINAGLDGRDERVLHAAQPDGVLATLFVGRRLPFQHGDVVCDAAQQAQHPALVNHR
jgi:hypothetical protein